MHWQVYNARNGELTLKLNEKFIYSNYKPYSSAEQWVISEFDQAAPNYLLIGLGLGYHLKAVAKLAVDKQIIVYYFDEEEYELFKTNNTDPWWKVKNIRILNNLEGITLENAQILLPNVLLNALQKNHPLFNLLEVIKMNQVSFKKNITKMLENFQQNRQLEDKVIKKTNQVKLACLVAAGPSLNETVTWLKKYEDEIDIFVVGAALKMLLAKDIKPKATILSDANDVTTSQFEGCHYRGELYYLSTANNKSVLLHEGNRFILYQEGYALAEKEAQKRSSPLIETGGSVGTTTFSLLEKLGYKNIVLFGQDLGFAGNHTHATLSTSGRDASEDMLLRKIEANDGTEINTTAMLQTFLYWYNEKVKETKVKVFNTATKGAKIFNVPLIDEEEFVRLISYRKGSIERDEVL